MIEAVQKTNSALMKSVDARLEEQRKAADSQNRSELLASKFSQFSQTLTGFRDSLTGLSERLAQEEQAKAFQKLSLISGPRRPISTR